MIVYPYEGPVVTDIIYSDTFAIDEGSTCTQLFVGTQTLVSDVYSMKKYKQFVNTLEDKNQVLVCNEYIDKWPRSIWVQK